MTTATATVPAVTAGLSRADRSFWAWLRPGGSYSCSSVTVLPRIKCTRRRNHSSSVWRAPDARRGGRPLSVHIARAVAPWSPDSSRALASSVRADPRAPCVLPQRRGSRRGLDARRVVVVDWREVLNCAPTVQGVRSGSCRRPPPWCVCIAAGVRESMLGRCEGGGIAREAATRRQRRRAWDLTHVYPNPTGSEWATPGR